MRPCWFPLAVLLFMGMCARAGEPRFEIPKEVILEAWRKNARADPSILEGIEYTIEFSSGEKTQVALDSKSLIVKGENGLIIYGENEVHVLTKKDTLREDPFQFLKLARNGKEYEYFGKFANQSRGTEKEKTAFSDRIGQVRQFLGDGKACFPFRVPEEFHFIGRDLTAKHSFSMESPFVEIESVVRENDGMVRLTYVENELIQAASQAPWQRVKMTLDPAKNYRVVKEDWVSLTPPSKWKSSRQFTYGPMFSKGPSVLLDCRSEVQFEDHPPLPGGKITFSGFRQLRLDPDRLKVSQYEREFSHDWLAETSMKHCGLRVHHPWREDP